MSKPIIFSGDMVRAMLQGRKTQTRLVVKPQPKWVYADRVPVTTDDADPNGAIVCPYGKPGDLLWVRETWRPAVDGDVCTIQYRSDLAHISIEDTVEAAERWGLLRRRHEQWPELKEPAWRPSIHMPRWASRITLRITDIRVERLRDITEKNALAEGITSKQHGHKTYWRAGWSDLGKLSRFAGGIHPRGKEQPLSVEDIGLESPQYAFAHLWDSINAKRGHAWGTNPWVWALTFELHND